MSDVGATTTPRTPRTEQEDAVARSVVDAALEVHRTIGPGFLESVYEQALAHELTLRAVPFVRQAVIEIGHKGKLVGEARLDFVVGGCVVELRSVDALADLHIAQTLSYLKASGHHLAFLVNFNAPLLKQGIRRLVL